MTALIVIAAGGTGGHMFPAQAFAEEMLAAGYDVALYSDTRGLRYAGGFADAVQRIEVPSATFSGRSLTQRIGAPLRITRGVMAAVWRMKRRKPVLVAGFGGYPAVPALAAARLLGVPYLIHEQNAVMGRVNRWVARRAGAVAIGIDPVLNPPKGARLVHVGNPVRGAVRDLVGAPYAPLEAEGPIHLTIFGGSQGAGVFSDVVPPAVAALPGDIRARLHVTQQARAEDADSVAAAYGAAGVAKADIAPFFDDMPTRLAAAHLVISRAGASTVAELGALGRPAILVPYPFATGDHQTANAQGLQGAGAAIVTPQSSFAPDALAEMLSELLRDPERLAAMAAAARAQGRPNAAQDLRDLAATLIP